MTLQINTFSATCLISLFLNSAPSHAHCPLQGGEVPPILYRAQAAVGEYKAAYPEDPTPLPGDLGFNVFCPSPIGGFLRHDTSPPLLSRQLTHDGVDYARLLIDQVAKNPDLPQGDLVLLGVSYFSCAKKLQELGADDETKNLILEAAIDQLLCSRDKLREESYDGLVGTLKAVFDLKF